MAIISDDQLDEMRAAHPFIGPLMAEALSCLCVQVNLIPNPPSHCCFRIGQEVIHDAGVHEDECCEGVAYVLLGDLYPSAVSFPEQDIVRQANANCAPPTWALHIKLGIIRCIPVGGMDPLSCEGWNSAAIQNVYDATALLKTSCCIRNYVIRQSGAMLGMSVVIDRQEQGNPLGGCVERSLSIALQIPNCECG